jgi:ATP-dependent Clp protease ATP-binding subunit ClpA
VKDQAAMPNKMERFTQRARNVLRLAQEEAVQFESPLISPEHLLLGMLKDEGSEAGRVLTELGVRYEVLKNAVNVHTMLAADPKRVQIDLAQETKQVLELAVDEARRMGHHYIGTEHLLLGITRLQTGSSVQLLHDMRITPEQIRQTTRRKLQEAPQSASASALSASSTTTLFTAFGRTVGNRRTFALGALMNRVGHYNLQRELDRTPLSDEVLNRLTTAVDEARQMGMKQVEVEHLLLSLLQSNPDIWDKLGYNPDKIDALRATLRQSIEGRRQE